MIGVSHPSLAVLFLLPPLLFSAGASASPMSAVPAASANLNGGTGPVRPTGFNQSTNPVSSADSSNSIENSDLRIVRPAMPLSLIPRTCSRKNVREFFQCFEPNACGAILCHGTCAYGRNANRLKFFSDRSAASIEADSQVRSPCAFRSFRHFLRDDSGTSCCKAGDASCGSSTDQSSSCCNQEQDRHCTTPQSGDPSR